MYSNPLSIWFSSSVLSSPKCLYFLHILYADINMYLKKKGCCRGNSLVSNMLAVKAEYPELDPHPDERSQPGGAHL